MFWIGAAPVVPGMPLSASMPPRPCSTAIRHHVVPGLAGLDAQAHRMRSGLVGEALDAAGRDPHDSSVESLVGDHHVRAAAEHQPVLGVPHASSAAAISSSRVVADDQADRRTTDPEGREGCEVVGHAAQAGSATRTCALPSTVSALKVTVRSMRAAPSSTDPTLATIVTVAPSFGSTSTGRVNRTW